MPVELTVVGSINLDLVARLERLPRPGETLAAHGFERHPGGKGANQALAAARLGAQVTLVGAVGDDEHAGVVLAGLEAAGVRLELARTGETGLALIYVGDDGETEIVVVAGANARLEPRRCEGAVLCQLEVSDEVVSAAAAEAAFFALNAAPARPLPVPLICSSSTGSSMSSSAMGRSSRSPTGRGAPCSTSTATRLHAPAHLRST